MNPRPRNLTARAASPIAGNPVNTLLETSVANCFPGLEFDVRSLDRRFFPGILFDFIPAPWYPDPDTPNNQQGARVAYADYQLDPMLPEDSPEPWIQNLLGQLAGLQTQLQTGRWYLDWVEQCGKRIEMYQDTNGLPYDGTMVWRLVRGLELDKPLTISLVQRNHAGEREKVPVILTGYRRRYLSANGVFDDAYQPGEFTGSMCVPWTHDFRDCACHYWAANHPDAVFAQPTAEEPGGEARDPVQANIPVDWLRADCGPSGAGPMQPLISENRPYQLDHYQINQVWEQLPFVVEGREIGATYSPPMETIAAPYPSPEVMIRELQNVMAPVELTLALQYLYAMFSLKSPEEAKGSPWESMPGDLLAARQIVMLVAAGEMTHMRWANQLLWGLWRHGLYPKGETYQPVIRTTSELPKQRASALRPLDPETLESFVRIERPGGAIDTLYARCVATLQLPGYPRHLYELAVHIDSDGIEHYSRFREVQRAFAAYSGSGAPFPYLRTIREGTPGEAAEALETYWRILDDLAVAYTEEAAGNSRQAGATIARARTLMNKLFELGDELAKRGIGIPFFTPRPATPARP